MRHTLVHLALPFLATVACEPRVEEPVPPARAAATSTAVASSAAKTASPAAEKRCIRASPAAPARTLPNGNAADPRCPNDPDVPPVLREGRVVFPDAKGLGVSVEIAEKTRDRTRGLMYRKHMPEDRGMIFRMDAREVHTFWMHNTCIPLDMLFIDEDGVIVGIEENVPTMDDSTFEVGCPSKYVLEMNAGWSRKNGVAAGQRVVLQGI